MWRTCAVLVFGDNLSRKYVLPQLRSKDGRRKKHMSYLPTDIPYVDEANLIENGLKKPQAKKPEII